MNFLMNIYQKNYADALRDEVIFSKISTEDSVLVVGAGNANYYKKLLPKCKYMMVTDIRDIDITDSDFLQCDFTKDFDVEKQFEKIIFSVSLEYIYNDILAMAVASKKLKRDGLIIIDCGFLVRRTKFAVRKYDSEAILDLAAFCDLAVQNITFRGFVSFLYRYRLTRLIFNCLTLIIGENKAGKIDYYGSRLMQMNVIRRNMNTSAICVLAVTK